MRYLLRYDASGSARGNGYIGYIAWVNLGLNGEGGLAGWPIRGSVLCFG